MKVFTQDQLTAITAALDSGAVVAVPTETVYGLAAKYDHPAAINKLSTIKGTLGRKDKYFTLMLPEAADIARYAILSPLARQITRRYFPGELTLVLPKNPSFSNPYRDQFSEVGIRIPDHHFMLALLKLSGPLVVSSANRSGQPPALDSQAVEKDLPEVDIVVAGTAGNHPPSTVLDLTTAQPQILRQGRVRAKSDVF